MEVKPGYKQTEVDVIPVDWELTPFLSLGSVIDGDRGTNYPGSRDFSSDGHCLFLNAGNVTKAGFRFDECAFISRKKDERLSKGKLKRDDIVLTTRGTVGNFAHFDSAVSFEHIRINSGMVILRNESAALDTSFLYTLFQSHFVEKQIERLTFGSAQPQLTVKGINEFAIVVPPLPEQRAIATALSDVDGLLGGLDQLIAKKRDLKQAAMQQLLTGQTRLPDFHGEWEVKRLGDAGKCLRGVSYKGDSDLSTHDTPHTKRLLRSNNVQDAVVITNEVQFVNAARVSSHQILQRDDILICMANGSKALVGKAGIFMVSDGHEYTFGAFMGCFRTNSTEANPAYVFYLFLTGRYRDYINNLLAGSSINNLRPSSIESLEFPMPPLPEQTAIAEVLTDMDAELAALEQRRNKTRALKQAMMQELLTGRTRLVARGGAENAEEIQ